MSTLSERTVSALLALVRICARDRRNAHPPERPDDPARAVTP